MRLISRLILVLVLLLSIVEQFVAHAGRVVVKSISEASVAHWTEGHESVAREAGFGE